MVAQVSSTINVREIMDGRKIFVMNLSKGRIGEDNSRLLGGMLITEIQLAAMERVDTPEKDRKDFFLYVDEFQNFANPSFANILSEARKYRLSLIMGHQYVAQLEEEVADAVFGNVGTMVTFRVGGADSEELVKEFTPAFLEEDLVNLPKYEVVLKLMIDGVASHPFTATTMPPIGKPTDSAEKVIKVSRERYSKKREIIEEKIMRWSGMGIDGEGGGVDELGDELGDSSVAPVPAPVKSEKTFEPLPVLKSGQTIILRGGKDGARGPQIINKPNLPSPVSIQAPRKIENRPSRQFTQPKQQSAPQKPAPAVFQTKNLAKNDHKPQPSAPIILKNNQPIKFENIADEEYNDRLEK